jgi:hypothetical protein
MEIARTSPKGVPDAAGTADVQFVPSEVKILPAAPGLVMPVPPLAAGNVPVTPVAKETFVIVLFEPLMVLFVIVSVLLAVIMLVGVMMLDRVAIIYSGRTQDVVASSHEYICPSVGIGVGAFHWQVASSNTQLWNGCGGMKASRVAS